MSIRLKMILSIVAVFLVGVVVVALFMRQTYEVAVHAAADTAVQQDAAVFAQTEKADTAKLSAVNIALQQNDSYRAAFEAKDRARLVALTKGVFSDLKSNFEMTHWYFEEPAAQGAVFLRVHKPEQFGDVLKRKTYLAASKNETQAAGLELGATAVALRVVRPYYASDGKTLIGYMETGQEINSFLDAVKRQTGDEVGLLLSKQSMDASGWAAARKSQGLEDNWATQANYVLAGVTNPDYADEMVVTQSASTIPANGTVVGLYKEGGRQEVRGVFPVADASGQPIGAVFLEHDLTATADQLFQAQLKVLAAVLMMMVIVLAVVVILMNSLVFHRLDAMMAHMQDISTRVAGGDYAVTYEKTGANDEIGHFEEFFGNFIELVGGALKQLSDAVTKRNS